jgi:hypothetical protein
MPVKPIHSQRFLRYAWIAARFHGIPNRRLPAFLEEVLLVNGVSDDTVDNAVSDVRASVNRDFGPGRPPASADGDDALVWTDWLRVDELGLGLRKALIRVPNEGWNVDSLVDALRSIAGVRQVIVTAEDREVLAVVIYRTPEEGANLRARIEEHAGRLTSGTRLPIRMHLIEYETHEPTRLTWLDIARREAANDAR